MSLEKMVTELDLKINRVYGEYCTLHEELNKHRGKQIGETNLDEVNRLLKEIQLKFTELYPAYYFITYRHEYATNVINSYNDFIKLLEKSGAKRDDEPRIIDTSIGDGVVS
jgi:uncharacterized lipoprotein YehR (DUF1307 family)